MSDPVFARPSLADLIARAEGDLDSRLPDAGARLFASNLNVLARIAAAGAHGLYGFMDRVWPELFPTLAETEFLDQHADLWGIARRPATAAAGTLTATGTEGTAIPAATVFLAAAGARYETLTEAVIAGGAAELSVAAVLPGTGGNLPGGSVLSILAPIAGLDAKATVGGPGLTGGAEAEDNPGLRARLLARIQAPPHGGAAHDYAAWALDQAGHGRAVTRAWVYPGEAGTGTVVVRIMTDGANADGLPAPADVTAVQAYIDGLRPVTAEVTVAAPVAAPLEFEIVGLDPDTPTVRAAVEAGLRALIAREAVPGGTLLISHIRAAVSLAAGETDHALAAPTANVAVGTGAISTYGGIVWS